MKLQRFFVEGDLDKGKDVSINNLDFIHQVVHVFRKHSGDKVILLDNSGFEFLVTIISLNKKEILVHIEDRKQVVNKQKLEVVLFASIIKKDKLEWVLEKCTEIGISNFIPIVSERSEKKDLNIERAKKILKEASEQSERGNVPTICEPVSLVLALNNVDFPVYAFHLEGKKCDFEKMKQDTKIGIMIGSEGGWGDKDLEIFKEKNIPLINLGSQVLRAETASVVVSAKILL